MLDDDAQEDEMDPAPDDDLEIVPDNELADEDDEVVGDDPEMDFDEKEAEDEFDADDDASEVHSPDEETAAEDSVVAPEENAPKETETAPRQRSSRSRKTRGSGRNPKVSTATRIARGRPADDTGNDAGNDAVWAPVDAFGQTRWVPFRDLRLEYKHWVNPRTTTGLDDASIAVLGNSIRSGTTSDESGVYAGVKQAMKVVQIAANGSIDLLVVDGQRRYLGVKAAGLPDDVMVPVVDLEPTPVDWTPAVATTYLLQALEEVGTRSGLSGFELSDNALRLRAQTDPATKKPYTIAVIAGVIGRSESWVSKILSARENASPALLLQWQKGEISEEMFKDLAALPKVDQRKKLAQVQELAKDDKGAARAAVKEAKEIVRQKAADAKAAAKPEKESTKAAKSKPVVRGPQQEIPATVKKSPPKTVIEDMLGLRTAHPPTNDYVKGVMDGIRWATGDIDASGFAKAWRDCMDRIVRAKKYAHGDLAETRTDGPLLVRRNHRGAAVPLRPVRCTRTGDIHRFRLMALRGGNAYRFA